MKLPFFKNLFEKDYDFPKDVVVLDFFKGWLAKHDKILFNFFNNALKANRTFIKKELGKWPIENQYDFLNSEILDIETFIKKNPIHCKVIFRKIGEIDELYGANEILDLTSLIHYPFLEEFFNAIEYHRHNLKEEHFQDKETALDIVKITIKLINQFKSSNTGINLDFYYKGSKNIIGLASYSVFVGYSIKIHYQLKAAKEQLVKEHPDLVFTAKPKKRLDLKKNIVEKLPLDWKDKPLSEYFYFIFRHNYPRECKIFEIRTTMEKRKTRQRIRSMNYPEQVKFLGEEVNYLSEVFESSDLQQGISLFTLSMEEHFIDWESKIELAQLITESDGYFYSEEEVSRNKDLIKMAEFMQDLPLLDPSSQPIQDSNFKENLNYLDKLMINPFVSNFLEVKSLLDKKEFIKGLLAQLEIEKNDEELLEKDESNDSNIRWYSSDAPFTLPKSYRKILLSMTPQQERKFFSFLFKESNNSETVFLSEHDTKTVSSYGLSLTSNPTDNYLELNLDKNKRPANIILYCFGRLFQKYGKNRRVKNDLALFLKQNISNFKDLSVDYIREEMRGGNKPKSMDFDIEVYL